MKVNILILGLVLLTALLLFFSSQRSFRKAVFDPCTEVLEHADNGIRVLLPYAGSLRHVMGTAELNAAAAQNLQDPTALRAWMAQQPSMDENPETATLMED